jgi:hypothetical protein
VLVLALGLLAHAPSFHAWLHATESGCAHVHADDLSSEHTPDHGHPPAGASIPSDPHFCAITAFAQGADNPTPAPLVIGPVLCVSTLRTHADAPGFVSPAHRLPASQAPPTLA